ncbi:MAG: cytochrome c biogenesis protein, partial [Flavobacteriales bacterium]
MKILKPLTIILLLYTLIAGLCVPLSPGVLNISDSGLAAGEKSKVTISTYNTELNPKYIKIRLRSLLIEVNKNKDKTDSSYYCKMITAQEIKKVNEQKIEVEFSIPKKLPNPELDLFIKTKKEGTFGQRSAITAIDHTKDLSVKGKCEISRNDKSGFTFAYQNILYESIRNLYFHVPMWFTMMLLMGISMVYSIKTLNNGQERMDDIAVQSVNVGVLFAFLGLVTGSVWAQFTWGAWWINDTKLNGAAVTTLIYLAYLILRNAIEDEQKKARISAVYNIFAFVMLILFLLIIPRMTDATL